MQVDTTNGWIGMCNLQGYKFVSSQCPTAVAPQKPTQILWTWTFHGVHLANFQKQHLVVMRNPISITLPRNEQSAQESLSKSKTWRLKITGSKKSSVCPRGPLRQRLLMRFPAAKMWTFFSEGLFTTSIKSKLKHMFWNLVWKCYVLTLWYWMKQFFQVSQLVGEVWWVGQISRNSLKG